MKPDLAAPRDSTAFPVVAVSGNPWLAGSLALACGAVALGYGVRAQASFSPLLHGLVALGFSLLMLLWALVAIDALLPRLVMDRHGVRLRFVRSWVGITWTDFGEATIRVRRGWWREDVFVPAGGDPDSEPLGHLGGLGGAARWQAAWMKRCFGSVYAVPVGWSTRVQGADGDLLAAISGLQSAPEAGTPQPGLTRPQMASTMASTLRARLRDPRPTIAAGITLGANALQLHPAHRRAVLPEADYLQRTEPELVEFADRTAEPTHLIAVPSEQDAPGADPTIGTALAKARLRLALTVPQLAERARIPAGVIEAIESGDFSISGGDFYARGQLRTLCRVLGLDVALLLAAYDTEIVAPDPVGHEALVAALTRQHDTSTGVRARRWSAAAAAVLVVALGWALAQLDQQTGPAIEPPASPSAPVQP